MVFSVVCTFSKIVFVILEILKNFPSAPDRLHSVFPVQVWSLLRYLYPLNPLSHSCSLPCEFCCSVICVYPSRYVSWHIRFLVSKWNPDPLSTSFSPGFSFCPELASHQPSSFVCVHFLPTLLLSFLDTTPVCSLPPLASSASLECLSSFVSQKLILYHLCLQNEGKKWDLFFLGSGKDYGRIFISFWTRWIYCARFGHFTFSNGR